MQEIVRRAAELQWEHPADDRALSLGGIEQVAAQVGIPPARVREAARDLERRDAAPVSRPAARGKGVTVVVDRVATGQPDEARRTALVEEIQASLGVVGHVSTLGQTVTWSPAADGVESRKVVITMTPRVGETRIHVEERFELDSWRLMIPGAGAFVAIMLVLLAARVFVLADSSWMVLPALLGGGAGGVLTATGFLRLQQERRRPELEALADRLVLLLEQKDQRVSSGARPRSRPRALPPRVLPGRNRSRPSWR
jgi:hypothetical protein